MISMLRSFGILSLLLSLLGAQPALSQATINARQVTVEGQRLDTAIAAKANAADTAGLPINAIADLPNAPRSANTRYIVSAARADWSSRTRGAIGGGTFVWNPTSTAAADNCLTVAVPGVPTGRFVRANVDMVTPEMCGARADDGGDDAPAIQAANNGAKALGVPLYLAGTYRTGATVRLDAQSIISGYATITRTLTAANDVGEVVRLVGRGSTGLLRSLSGQLRAQFSGKPVTTQTLAHAFVFEGLINAKVDSLIAGSCAYAFVNDAVEGPGVTGRFWGNSINQLYSRGAVQGYMKFPTPGAGAHTENFIGLAYFNGQETNNSTLLPKQDIPINLDNAEGWVFGTLNMEWTTLNIASGNFTATIKPFFRIGLMSNIIINAFHPEGLTLTGDNADFAVFYFDSTGADEGSLSIKSWHVNNWALNLGTSGTLSLVGATTASDGRAQFDFFSGKSNTISAGTRVHIKNQTQTAGSSVAVILGERANYGDLGFSVYRKGTTAQDLEPDIYLGATPWVNDVQVATTAAMTTLDVQKTPFARASGTAATALANITAAPKFTNERTRTITLTNETNAAITLVSGGNIRLPFGAAFPLTWGPGRKLVITYDFANNLAEITGLSVASIGSSQALAANDNAELRAAA